MGRQRVEAERIKLGAVPRRAQEDRTGYPNWEPFNRKCDIKTVDWTVAAKQVATWLRGAKKEMLA